MITETVRNNKIGGHNILRIGYLKELHRSSFPYSDLSYSPGIRECSLRPIVSDVFAITFPNQFTGFHQFPQCSFNGTQT